MQLDFKALLVYERLQRSLLILATIRGGMWFERAKLEQAVPLIERVGHR